MTYDEIWRHLTAVYDEREAKAVARTLLGEGFGLTLTDICCGKVTQLSSDDICRLDKMLHRLEKSEPVQYVLGWEWFGGRRFRVEEGVLIPRPETEDLCRWAEDACRKRKQPSSPRILDIGTGSGCIAITLALNIENASVGAWDISSKALAVAETNARELGACVTFERQDALHAPDDIDRWDIIVSNPPYICEQEKVAMHANVLAHEPSLALFVPDGDPLLFYRAIARYASHALTSGGALLFEINPLYADDMPTMLAEEGFRDAETCQDAFGKTRFVKAVKP